MSISLPNGTILAAPSSSTSQVSAAVTRILHLSNFSAELKTRDIQAMFKDWENEKGGFRIKWVDDVNALVVFSDASIAKRAYLSFLLQPPAAFPPPAQIRPYDRPDAAQIIQSLAARSLGHRSSMSSALTSGHIFPPTQQPIEGLPNPIHSRTMSMSNPSSNPLNSFVMPIKAPLASRASISGTNTSRIGGIGIGHNRTGSASSNWARQSLGSGVLNFGGSSNGSRKPLPTHSESSASSTSDPDPMVLMDTNVPLQGNGSGRGSFSGTVRRESVSADKAMREVQKALASVEAQG